MAVWVDELAESVFLISPAETPLLAFSGHRHALTTVGWFMQDQGALTALTRRVYRLRKRRLLQNEREFVWRCEELASQL